MITHPRFGGAGPLLLCVSASPVVASRAPLWRGSVSLQGAGRGGVAHGLSRPEACGRFLDRGSSPRLLHRQVDALPPGKARVLLCLGSLLVQLVTEY